MKITKKQAKNYFSQDRLGRVREGGEGERRQLSE